jgi:hypothetical protein
MPHGADFRRDAGTGRARCIAGPRRRGVGVDAIDLLAPKIIGLPAVVEGMI